MDYSSRALAVSPQTDSVMFRDLVHTLIPGGIPLFLVLLHRYVKKHTSAYMRAGIISVGVGLYVSRVFRGYFSKMIKDYFMCSAELHNGDDGYEMLLSVSNIAYNPEESDICFAWLGHQENENVVKVV